MRSGALVIGSTDGIGLALTRLLLERGWQVVGLGRRASPLTHERYRHAIADVREPDYARALGEAAEALEGLDLCVYCAGIAHALDLDDPRWPAAEADVVATNLSGAVITVGAVLPRMLAAGRGHIIGLSSLADGLRDAGAPSYAASKAGLSSYLEGMALATARRGVAITNVRLGFVRTRLGRPRGAGDGDAAAVNDADGDAGDGPFVREPDAAARRVMACLDRRPLRVTYPRRMAVLLWFLSVPARLRLAVS